MKIEILQNDNLFQPKKDDEGKLWTSSLTFPLEGFLKIKQLRAISCEALETIDVIHQSVHHSDSCQISSSMVNYIQHH